MKKEWMWLLGVAGSVIVMFISLSNNVASNTTKIDILLAKQAKMDQVVNKTNNSVSRIEGALSVRGG